MLYSLPLAFISRDIERDPDKAGFFTMIGLIPENSRIGANITRINRRAKQNP